MSSEPSTRSKRRYSQDGARNYELDAWVVDDTGYYDITWQCCNITKSHIALVAGQEVEACSECNRLPTLTPVKLLYTPTEVLQLRRLLEAQFPGSTVTYNRDHAQAQVKIACKEMDAQLVSLRWLCSISGGADAAFAYLLGWHDARCATRHARRITRYPLAPRP